MDNQAQKFSTVSSTDMYSQGGMANHTGSMNEVHVNDQLRNIGLQPEKRRYESSWSPRSEVDCDLEKYDKLGICAEYKTQNVSGTADQKGGTELYNAGKKIVCDDYVLVFSGSHWEHGRGQKLFEMYKEMASDLNAVPDRFCVAAKKLHVMKKYEFIEFVEQRNKEKLQNG